MRVSCNTLLMDYGRLTQSLRSHVTSTISLIYNTTGYNSACRNSTSHCVHDHLIYVHFDQVSSIGALFPRNRIYHVSILYSLKATSTDSLRLDVPRIRRLGHRGFSRILQPNVFGTSVNGEVGISLAPRKVTVFPTGSFGNLLSINSSGDSKNR